MAYIDTATEENYFEDRGSADKNNSGDLDKTEVAGEVNNLTLFDIEEDDSEQYFVAAIDTPRYVP